MQKQSLSLFALMSLVLCLAGTSYAQTETPAKGGTATVANGSAPAAITATTTPVDLARAALAAQGGDKFKSVTSMVLIGTVDLYAPNSTQSIPGKFVMVTAGDKMRIDIDARPAVSFKTTMLMINKVLVLIQLFQIQHHKIIIQQQHLLMAQVLI